jgi:hypothetical protein
MTVGTVSAEIQPEPMSSSSNRIDFSPFTMRMGRRRRGSIQIHAEHSGPFESHGGLIFFNCEGYKTLQAVNIPGTGMTAEAGRVREHKN